MTAVISKAETVGGLCGLEGDNMISWELDLNFGLLTISGEGRMADFDDPSEAPWWSYSKSIVHLIVEDGITHVSQAGFQYMPYLESAEIAETVTSIGDYAFYGSILNKVIPTNWMGDIDANLLPNGLLAIGYYAFAETRLENITLPTTLEKVGAAAFAYNDLLLEVTSLATTPPASERAVFYDCNKLWAIHVPDDQVEAYNNADGWATYTDIIVPASGHAEHPSILPEKSDLLMPGSMYATDLGQTSALIICSLPDGATAWNLNYRQETADDEQEMRWVTIDNLTTRSCTLEDLKPATNYVVRLQAVYEDGQVSGWTRALPFATASEDVDRQNKQETAYYEYKEVKKAECDAMAMPEIDDKHCALFIEQAKQAIDDLGFNENLSFDENFGNLDEITRLLAIDLSLHRAEMAGEQRGGITIDETTFPDETFRNWILKQSYGKDGVLTEQEIAGVKEIDVAYHDIKSLKGIEFFTALERLWCGNLQDGLDLSKNTALTDLRCSHCNLKELDLSKNTALKWLICSNNQLTTIDLSNNTALDQLNVSNNQLTELDVSKNTLLTYLTCYNNKLTGIDVSQNSKLKMLSCYYNEITELDVTKNLELEILSCGDNKLTTLDVTKNSALTDLQCSSNLLTELDVSKNLLLSFLGFGSNQLTAIDVSQNKQLYSLRCTENLLKSLDVSNCPELVYLFCQANQLTSLVLPNQVVLKHLECIKNQITELDLSQCVALEWIDCSHNQLTMLDVSNNPALKDLYCHGNQLTALDLSQNPKLEMLGIHQNQIGSASMGALIESLPTITEGGNGTIHAISDKDEQNVITADQIAAAYAKGWTPMYFDSYWKPYAGSDPSAINSVKTIVADGTWYDLSGRRLQGAPTQKGIYVHNGRKYINK
jgi:Leucine-rich repeat (LRR) protein